MTQSLYIRDKNLDEEEKVSLRQEYLVKKTSASKEDLSGFFASKLPLNEVGDRNCENLVGSVELPVGVAGPVSAQLSYSEGFSSKKPQTEKQTFFIPLATTEGALVASVHRGLKVLDNNGVSVFVRKMGMTRSVVFEADSHKDLREFIEYFKSHEDNFAQYCEATSNHLKYISCDTFTRGKLGYFRFVFDTDEAMGMNMVTIALAQAWEIFTEDMPEKFQVKLLTLSGNVCTDKKDSAINRLYGRGYAVTLEAHLSEEVLQKILKISSRELVKIHTVKNLIGSNVAGSFSQNMHVANALAAVYAATGQDIAHTVAGSEASVHFEESGDGGAYASLTLPNISVGTVGGGTWLPKQAATRKLILQNKKNVSAKELAAAIGLACFAGEISGLSALASHTLASAHKQLGRS